MFTIDVPIYKFKSCTAKYFVILGSTRAVDIHIRVCGGSVVEPKIVNKLLIRDSASLQSPRNTDKVDVLLCLGWDFNIN